MKKVSSKKVEKILKQTDHFDEEKKFKTGEVSIKGSQQCQPRLVNFFGDIHTEVFTVQASANDELLGVGCSNGDVKVYNIFQGKLLTLFNSSRKGGYPNTSFRWKPNSNQYYVACNSDGTVKWYDGKQQTVIGHHQSQIGYLCCDYDRTNGQWCIFGKENYQLEIFDHQTKKLRQRYEGSDVNAIHPNHTNRVFSIRTIKDDPNVWFSGGWDSTIKVWDIRVGTNSVRTFFGPTISADSLDYNKGEILVGNYQNYDIVQLWDFKSGKLIETLDIGEPNKGNSYCFTASYAQNSQHQVIGVGLSGSNKVKIIKNKCLVAEIGFQAAPLSLDFYKYNNKDYMLVGGVEGTIYAFKIKWLK